MKKNKNRIKMRAKLKKLGALIKNSFFNACNALEIVPVFYEAAGGGSSSGGVKYHGKAIIGLPGAKYHAMTGQAENSADVRRTRANGRAHRNQVIGRPAYYSDYDKYNNFTV